MSYLVTYFIWLFSIVFFVIIFYFARKAYLAWQVRQWKRRLEALGAEVPEILLPGQYMRSVEKRLSDAEMEMRLHSWK